MMGDLYTNLQKAATRQDVGCNLSDDSGTLNLKSDGAHPDSERRPAKLAPNASLNLLEFERRSSATIGILKSFRLLD